MTPDVFVNAEAIENEGEEKATHILYDKIEFDAKQLEW